MVQVQIRPPRAAPEAERKQKQKDLPQPDAPGVISVTFLKGGANRLLPLVNSAVTLDLLRFLLVLRHSALLRRAGDSLCGSWACPALPFPSLLVHCTDPFPSRARSASSAPTTQPCVAGPVAAGPPPAGEVSRGLLPRGQP